VSEQMWTTERTTTTRYWVGAGALEELRAWLEPLPHRVPIVADAEVWALYGEELRSALHPCRPLVFLVEDENDKELGTVERLVSELVANRVHRREKLVCFGSGVCCDVGGMLALVYMRGMAYGIVATSLMAQVDAAIGGKVGCNFGTRKNLLGGFHQPDVVLCDPDFLETVPERPYRAALAEALKLGVILPDLGIPSLLDELGDRDPEVLTQIVERCVRGKIRLLDPDPYEHDLDRLLNLGHTVAHALEKVEDCGLLHGEAVAIGLAAKARYAEREGLCTPEHANRIVSQLERLELPTSFAADPSELEARLSEIPDHRGGQARLVVPVDDAGARVIEGGDLDLLAECISLAAVQG
jgi:3-dehydroquinate synthase